MARGKNSEWQLSTVSPTWGWRRLDFGENTLTVAKIICCKPRLKIGVARLMDCVCKHNNYTCSSLTFFIKSFATFGFFVSLFLTLRYCSDTNYKVDLIPIWHSGDLGWLVSEYICIHINNHISPRKTLEERSFTFFLPNSSAPPHMHACEGVSSSHGRLHGSGKENT
jgi:hypothetical protein